MRKLLKSMLAILLVCAMLVPCMVVFADEESEPVSFTDVDADDWFAPYVDYCSGNGLVNGMTATTFEPNTSLSRAMFVTLLYRFEEAEATEGAQMPFTDVSEKHWARDAILWAYENEIVNGMTPTTFQPDAKITREQMCTILCRFADGMGYAMPEADYTAPFSDEDEIAEFAYDYVYICYAAGIVNGITEDSFGPRQNATRAQACTILQRFIRFATTEFTVTEEENGKSSFTYSDKYGVYAKGYDITDENGNITESYYEEGDQWYREVFTYNEDGNLLRDRYDDSDGYWEEENCTYNEYGLILTQGYENSDEYGYNYAYTYNENNAVVNERYDDCYDYWYEESYFYDEDGNPLEEKYEDSDGYIETTTYTYDEAGKLTECKVTDSDGYEQNETYTYNEAGDITEYLRLDTDGGEALWKYTYNDDGLIERITQYEGDGVVGGDFTYNKWDFGYEDVAGEKKVGLFLFNSGDADLVISQVYSEDGYLDLVMISVQGATRTFRLDDEGNVTYVKLEGDGLTLESVEGSFSGGMPNKVIMDVEGVKVSADIDWETMEVTMTDGNITETDTSGSIPMLIVTMVEAAENYEEITVDDVKEVVVASLGL